MRRGFLGAIGAGLLAILLAASILASLRLSRAGDATILRSLDEIGRSDFALQRDVLLVRAGLLGDYDPLVAESDRITASLGRLCERLGRDGTYGASAHALVDAVVRQQELTERFKSEQALARNSLSYLPLLGQQVSVADGPAAGPVQALTQSVLRLVVENTPAAAQELQLRIGALSAVSASPDQASMLHYLVQHALLLERVLPQVDALLHGVVETRLPERIAAVREEAEARSAALQSGTRVFLMAVDGLFVVLLFVLTGRFVLNLRRRRVELEERAAAEKIVALISMRFVACEPERTGDVLDAALAAVGRRTGLDRVSVVLRDPERLHVWDRREEPPPAELRRQLVAAADEAAAVADDMFDVRIVANGPGAAGRRLAATGVRRLAGFRLYNGEQPTGYLTFEARRRSTRWPVSGVALYGSAARVIEKALTQERLAAEREAQQPRLRQAQRLATAGALASGLAHNLNNIIGAVLGHAEMVSECLARATSPAEHVDEIRQAAERAAELVDTMLNFGRRDLQRDEVAISELMSETLSLLRVTLPARVQLSTEDTATGALVVGRSAELQQVMLNLVRNAAQAVDGAGRITLRLTLDEVTAARQLPLGTLEAGEYVMLTVSDTGSGMDEATLARIFEPFFTTRPAGSGLGLATVADIVRDHGGVIDVRSAKGRGSVFRAWFPRARAIGTRARATAGNRGQGEIVLFVEPDAERRLQIEDVLAALGYEPASFADWSAAIDALERAPSEFDVALIYPSAAGEAVEHDMVTRLRAARPGIPVAVVGDTARTSAVDTARHRAVVVEPRSGTVGLAASLSNLLGEQHGALHR